jgi:hypothetical protein
MDMLYEEVNAPRKWVAKYLSQRKMLEQTLQSKVKQAFNIHLHVFQTN